MSFSSCIDSHHFVFRHIGVFADQHNRGALLAANCANVFRISITKSVDFNLWEYGLEKCCWKPDYELYLRKTDGEAACTVIIQVKLSFKCSNSDPENSDPKNLDPETSAPQIFLKGISQPERSETFIFSSLSLLRCSNSEKLQGLK